LLVFSLPRCMKEWKFLVTPPAPEDPLQIFCGSFEFYWRRENQFSAKKNAENQADRKTEAAPAIRGGGFFPRQ